jgi:hypothetical protein
MTSTARSSGYNDQSGATERTLEREWRGAVAYANINLTGGAISTSKPALRKLFKNLLAQKQPVLGLLLCGVGNIDVPMKKKLEQIITDAFRDAGATEHDEPLFIWSHDETMAAFRAEVQVRALDPLTEMKRVDAWRMIQRFRVTGATEHGSCSMLIYNTYQPKSQKRKMSATMGVDFCKAVLRDAMAHAGADPSCVGFGFGGDATCSYGQWIAACAEVPEYRDCFKQLSYIRGVGGKAGDLMVCAGMEGLDFYDNTCCHGGLGFSLEGREKQHDPMVMEWCYRAQRRQPTMESITDKKFRHLALWLRLYPLPLDASTTSLIHSFLQKDVLATWRKEYVTMICTKVRKSPLQLLTWPTSRGAALLRDGRQVFDLVVDFLV